MSGPLLLAVESSCDETGDRAGRGRPPDPRQRRRQPGRAPRADRRHRARGRGAGPPALDRARAGRGARHGRASPWPTWTASRSPTARGSRARCSSGINFAKTLAWAHGKPLVPVNHLEGHVYAGWLLDPGEAEREAPPFPLVALVVSGGHTFLVEMRDHLDYRLLGTDRRRRGGRGVRQGRAAAGPRLPGRAGDLAGGRGRGREGPRLPAGLDGRLVRPVSFSGLKTAARRIIGAGAGRRGPAGRRARGRPLPGRRRRRARLGLPGLGGGRARDEDDPGGRGGRGARDRARRRRRRQRGAAGRGSPAEAAARGIAMVIPRPGPVHRQRGDDRRRRGAAVRRGRARRAWTSTPGRRCRSPDEPRTGEPRDLRLDPRYVQRTPPRRRPARAPQPRRQNFLADVDVLEGILREADPGPGRGRPGDRARVSGSSPAGCSRRARR